MPATFDHLPPNKCSTDELLIAPFADMHAHLRQGDALNTFVRWHTGWTSHVLAMPNLAPVLATPDDAARYGAHIQELTDRYAHDVGGKLAPFKVLPTLYLTQDTTPNDIRAAKRVGIAAVKLYPAGVTTGSAAGVGSLKGLRDVFAAMADEGLRLCVHGEHPGSNVLDAEADYLGIVDELLVDHPDLYVILEHISTAKAVAFVGTLRRSPRLAGSITVHHLFLTFRDVVHDKLYPDNFCKPVAKHEDDRTALVRAATSGDVCFFLGTDSAPHPTSAKYGPSCCAGVFTAPVAMPLLVELFERCASLGALEAFTTSNARYFYGLEDRGLPPVKLLREPHVFNAPVSAPDGSSYRPFWTGQPLSWAPEAYARVLRQQRAQRGAP